MLELVIFDMAGTTVHDEQFVGLCLQQALHQHGIPANLEEIKAVMGFPKPDAIRVVSNTYKGAGATSPEQVANIHNTFLQSMLNFYENDPRVKEIDGATNIFNWLRSKNIKVGLDTGFSRDIADTIINRLGWEQYIDVSVTSDEVENGRPAPDLAQKAMALLGINDPKTVAKIGDTISDLHEGTAAGCGWVIGVESGAYTREELSQHPHTHIVTSIKMLPEIV